MPMGNRNGPLGQGPRTGRAAGFCAGFGSPGYRNRRPGFRFGCGFRGGRGGRGWRHWLYATGMTGRQSAQSGLAAVGSAAPAASSVGEPADTDPEEQQLCRQLATLQSELATVQQRVRQLETKAEKQPGAAGPAPAWHT